MDKLIKYINARPHWGINIFYSTPETYIAKLNTLNVSFPNKYDDFMPYADNPVGYWTGYFTSRIALKLWVKEAGRFLQSTRTLFGLLAMNKDTLLTEFSDYFTDAVDVLEESMGIN